MYWYLLCLNSHSTNTLEKYPVGGSHLHTHTHTHTLLQFQGMNSQAWSSEQGRAYSFSSWHLLTLTYRCCITLQYCTEVCRQHRADTSKRCGKFSLLHGALQPCHRCSKVGQRGAGRGQAWLKASVAGFKDGTPYFPLGWVKVRGVCEPRLTVSRSVELSLRRERNDLDW